MIAPLLALCLQSSAIKVRLVTDEPEIALQILNRREKHEAIPDIEWKALFESDGYRRLKARELGMKRSFADEDFKTFMLADSLLSRRQSLEDTLAHWKNVDVAACAQRSLAYLPTGSKISASVYFLIKPKTNSFVWDTDSSDPAVMLYLDPAQPSEDLAITIAHEFHHIGYSSTCPSAEYKAWHDKQPEPKKIALTWLRAFGEGFAVLASGGSSDFQPYQFSGQEVKDAWRDGIAHNRESMRQLESFFREVLSGRMNEEQARAKAMEFYGTVGPWYTTGWIMATSIEKAFGRERLLKCYEDPRLLLATYNEAARKLTGLPRWPEELVAALGE
jgi:hypothetical protein